jgi:hypothetical protein
MFTEKAVFDDIARDQWQERRVTATGPVIVIGERHQGAFPYSAPVGLLGQQARDPDKRVGQPPDLSIQLPQGLGKPAGQGQIIKFPEATGVVLPELMQGFVGIVTDHQKGALLTFQRSQKPID